jgi:hypothetical protein
MPTPTGLPKVGEVWERTWSQPPAWHPDTVRFVVLERGSGSYWSLRVYVANANPGNERQLWVDSSYWFSRGQLKYLEPAGPETKKKLGLA